MNIVVKHVMQMGVIFVICLGLFNLQPASADGNIDNTYKYAWSENSGWENFKSIYGGVMVDNTYLSGYAWAENVGWVKLGSGMGGPYANTTNANWGVNRNSATGALSGYAWSENAGWINFGITANNNDGVSIDVNTLKFSGYAWAENVGFIHFQNLSPEYYVMQEPGAPVATAANAITQTGFTANWNAAAGATGYRLDVATDSGFTSFVSGYRDKDVGTVTAGAVAGITGGTTYYYRIRAKKTGGTSDNSNTIEVTTLPLTTKVNLTGPSTATAGAVSTVFTLTSQDADGNASNVTADTIFNLSSNSSGTKVFYRDTTGTAVITRVTILNGTSTATFYYKDSHAGTPTLTAAWNSGGTDLGSDILPVTVSLAATTLATSTSVPSAFKEFKITVTKIEMDNGTGTTPVTIFSGSATLDLVNGGTFPGINGVPLPAGTYRRIMVTFKNSIPVTGTLSYGGTAYYTTDAAFGGASNVAGDPSNDPDRQTVFTFRISEWGALGADRTETINITPVTVDASTDYQPTLRFTISKTFLLKGTAGTEPTYYFELSPPMVIIVEP